MNSDDDDVFHDCHAHPWGSYSWNKPGVVHPILQVARVVVSHLHDYPSLMCLSMTCKTFHAVIHNSRSKLPNAFSNLERAIPDDNSSDNLPGFVSKDELHTGPCSPLRAEDWQRRFFKFKFVELTPGHFSCDFDMLRHNTCQLPTLDWLPCYGCMRIQRRATHFFADQTLEHCDMFGCDALSRRCISCSIADRRELFRKRLRYLQDMPRGLAGYRLRCSICRTIEWAVSRPRKRQESRKLCTACFHGSLAEEEPVRMMQKEWGVFAAMPVVYCENTKRKVLVVEEEKAPGSGGGVEDEVLDAASFIDQYKSWCRFEVLSIEGT